MTKTPGKPFNYALESGFEFAAQKFVSVADKAMRIFAVSADSESWAILDKVIQWIRSASKDGSL